MVSIKQLKKHHGKWAPNCLYIRTWAKLNEDEWCDASKYHRVLDLAGVTKQRPIGRPYYWAENPDWVQAVARSGDRYPTYVSGATIQRWVWTPCIIFDTVVPKWARQLAYRLTSDQDFIKKVGGSRRKVRTSESLIYFRYELPIEMRARVIRAAAANAMSREFMEDDLEAALILLKDAL
jgi:hypothetical protein